MPPFLPVPVALQSPLAQRLPPHALLRRRVAPRRTRRDAPRGASLLIRLCDSDHANSRPNFNWVRKGTRVTTEFHLLISELTCKIVSTVLRPVPWAACLLRQSDVISVLCPARSRRPQQSDQHNHTRAPMSSLNIDGRKMPYRNLGGTGLSKSPHPAERDSIGRGRGREREREREREKERTESTESERES
eukprot:COSAG03_NODE_28_length_18724_cov_10.718128_15_plen_190_part_00